MIKEEDNTMPKAADRWRIAKSPVGQNVFSPWLDTPAPEAPNPERSVAPMRPAPSSWVENLRDEGRFQPLTRSATGSATAKPWKSLTPVRPSPSLEEMLTAVEEANRNEPEKPLDTRASIPEEPTPPPATTTTPLPPLFPARQRIYSELVSRAFGNGGDLSSPPSVQETTRLPAAPLPALPAPLERSPVRMAAILPLPAPTATGHTPDPAQVEALLPGMLHALAQALIEAADTRSQETREEIPIDATLHAQAHDYALALIDQARALISQTLTMANDLAERAHADGSVTKAG
ncbi:MAG: hypothetical protein HQL99_11470 [Magnetococcales bacterium]|nr:hypothetical protein [Magnetococcales bacterium]